MRDEQDPDDVPGMFELVSTLLLAVALVFIAFGAKLLRDECLIDMPSLPRVNVSRGSPTPIEGTE